MSQDISLEIREAAQPVRTVRLAFVVILVGHVTVDVLAALVPSSAGLIEARLGMSAKQTAWLIGLGPLCSGLSQPICALLSDLWATRRLGVVGLVLGGLGIGALGLVNNFAALVIAYSLGAIGIGMFHPIGASTIGQLWHERRTSAMSCFFVAGMVGGVLGSLVWPRFLASAKLATSDGFRWLPLVIVPVVILAVVLHKSFAGLMPLHAAESETEDTEQPSVHWELVGVLYVASALRFCVNTALAYLFVRWVQHGVAIENVGWTEKAIAKAAAPYVGNLNAAMLLGMAVGGLSSGVFVRPGKEKWPLVLVPLGFAPVIALFPYLPVSVGYVLAVAAGIGFASMIPVSIAKAQRLMPGRTNLASSLMMGGAWAVAVMGPMCAEMCVAWFGLSVTFLATAATLALAGLVCLPIAESAD